MENLSTVLVIVPFMLLPMGFAFLVLNVVLKAQASRSGWKELALTRSLAQLPPAEKPLFTQSGCIGTMGGVYFKRSLEVNLYPAMLTLGSFSLFRSTLPTLRFAREDVSMGEVRKGLFGFKEYDVTVGGVKLSLAGEAGLQVHNWLQRLGKFA